MRGTSLRGANLSCAVLDKADLRAATMARPGTDTLYFAEKRGPDGKERASHVDFSNCSMKRASLNGANLKGANFTGAMLQGAEFKGAKLVGVTFHDAVLTGVNLADLQVPPEALAGAITEPSAESVARAVELKAMLDSHERWIRTGGRDGEPANYRKRAIEMANTTKIVLLGDALGRISDLFLRLAPDTVGLVRDDRLLLQSSEASLRRARRRAIDEFRRTWSSA